MTAAPGRPPAAPHGAPRVSATVDSRALCAPGASAIDRADDGLGVNAILVRDRPVPDACHSPIMPTHGRVVTPELINPTSLTDATLPEFNQQLFVPFLCYITVLHMFAAELEYW